MTTPAAPSNPKPAGDDRNLVAVDENYVALSFEDRLRLVWKNHGNFILAGCAAVLLALLVQGGWDFYGAQREAGIEGDYAAAGTPEKLQAFAAAHAGHALAGLARLRLADTAYAAGKFADALAGYGQAGATLKTGPFAARAQLGAAMAKLGAGRVAEGEAALKLLAADAGQLKSIRAEATYHLASLAAEAGRAADVAKFSDELMQIDPASTWTQRTLMLRASLPAAGAKPDAAAPATPMISFKPGGT